MVVIIATLVFKESIIVDANTIKQSSKVINPMKKQIRKKVSQNTLKSGLKGDGKKLIKEFGDKVKKTGRILKNTVNKKKTIRLKDKDKLMKNNTFQP